MFASAGCTAVLISLS